MSTAESQIRNGDPDDQIVLGVLDAVDRDASVTQRSVARELGIALGLANAYVKRCVRKGFIKVSQVPRRRYAYYLTPQGFSEKSRLTASYFAYSLSFFRTARLQCSELFKDAHQCGQRRLVILGEGDLAEVASLVALQHPVEIVRVMPIPSPLDRLAHEVAALGRVDAVVITALTATRELYDSAVATFGRDRVYVPALLRLGAPREMTGTEKPVQ